jgi:hypothetical protein
LYLCYVVGMVYFVAFILILLIIGVVVVVRSGEREVAMDRKDQELPTPSEEFQMLPHLKLNSEEEEEERKESWTLDSVEDSSHDHEGS